MQYNGFSVLVALLALLVLFIALRILFDRHWILGWLRGTCGLLILGAAMLIGLVAYDLSRYAPVPKDRPLLTLSFQRAGDLWQVEIQEQGNLRKVTLEGDLWQLDVQVLSWKGLAGLIGLRSGYRLERLNGRFFAMEQQQQARYTQVELASSPYAVDLWRWLNGEGHDLYILDAQAQRLSYLPIADGALFSLNLTRAGLQVLPINQAGKQVMPQ
jgi:hypothetical protein